MSRFLFSSVTLSLVVFGQKTWDVGFFFTCSSGRRRVVMTDITGSDKKEKEEQRTSGEF